MTYDQCDNCLEHSVQDGREICICIESIMAYEGDLEEDGTTTIDMLERAWYYGDVHCNIQKIPGNPSRGASMEGGA